MKINKTVIGLISFKIVLIASIFLFNECKRGRLEKEMFGVAFLTDIHLQPELEAVAGFSQALDSVNRLKPDFIITGGDLIMDALGQTYGRSDSVYNLYQEAVKKAEMPVYNTLGNHEIYGIYTRSGADPLHPEYGEKMFEKRLGKSYQAFEHRGWKFMILNSVEDTKKNRYKGVIDDDQIAWIKEELNKTDPATPIVISTHIPFITANTQKYVGSTVASDSSTVVYNSKYVLELFNGHNLKLVLQGHLHTLEDIYIDGIHFITGGAVSAGWWKGPNRGVEEGFLYLKFNKDSFTWRYVDYSWVPKK
jgi:3',5'-cyclic AMP phosphodiesterase CpdA